VATLTNAAAKRVHDEYDIDAIVIPHGPTLTVKEIRLFRQQSENRTTSNTVYVHVKGGRKNLEWFRLLHMAPRI